MKRDLEAFLLQWRNSKQRKPILLRGGRQVGKSYLARQLGTTFPLFVEVNFEHSPGLAKIFELDMAPVRITTNCFYNPYDGTWQGETNVTIWH